jgi:hypothetical protein
MAFHRDRDASPCRQEDWRLVLSLGILMVAHRNHCRVTA